MSALELFKSRNADMGIVWIFATLGRQSRVRNVSKKAVAQVDIRAACRIVAQPEQPVPLRISSQLMAGLARVYVSQAETWMSDVVAVHSNVRRMALSIVTEYETIDLPRTSRTVRKETITFKLPQLPEGLFEFERTVEVPPGAALSPERTARPQPKHTASQDKITLPLRVSLMDDQSESMLFASDLGTGLLNWDPNEGQSGLDLGLFSDYDRVPGVEAQDPGLIPPDFPHLSPSNPNESFAPLLSAADWITSRDDGLPSFGRSGVADDLPPMEMMPGLEPQPSGPRPGSPSQAHKDPSGPSWEDPYPLRGTKRRKVTSASWGPLVDITIEMSEQDLFRQNGQYTRLMAQLAHKAQVKAAEKHAGSAAEQYLEGLLDFPAQSEALRSFWTNMVSQAKHNCGKKDISSLRGIKRGRRAFGREDDPYLAHDEFQGMGRGAHDDLPPIDDMPPLEGMPDVTIGQDPLFPNVPPLEGGPLIIGGDASIISTSDVGVGRDLGSTAGSREGPLPWNMPSMFERMGSDVPQSLSGTPSRFSGKMPWGSLHSQPSPLPLPRPDTPGDLSAWDPATTDLARPHASLESAGHTQARLAHYAAVEEDNFSRYMLAVARSLPVPPPAYTTESKTRSLFFSDVAPVAEASPAVAAQAFCHVLALVTAGKMKVRQHEPYAELVLSIPDPEMTFSPLEGQVMAPTRRNSLASPRIRGTGSRSRSGTSGSGRGGHSRDNSFSAYLSMPSPGTAA